MEEAISKLKKIGDLEYLKNREYDLRYRYFAFYPTSHLCYNRRDYYLQKYIDSTEKLNKIHYAIKLLQE